MPSNSFQIFSSLTPVKGHYADSPKASAHPETVLELSIRDGEPFLTWTLDKLDKRTLSPTCIRIYEEIKRISQRDDIFGIRTSATGKIEVSLWENPYLLNLIEKEGRIKNHNGNIISFTDQQALLILKITRKQSSPFAALSLLMRWNDRETQEFVFLDDKHILNGDMIYEVKSVGVNFPYISSLISPVEKELLEQYLTLFLTYVENVLPELNGNIACKVQHAEQTVPTIFLEKVASDKALYLRVAPSLESLDDSLPEGFEPSYAATISEDDKIIIREVEGCNIEEKIDLLEKMIRSAAPDRNAKKELFREGSFFIIPEATAGPFLLNCLPQLLHKFKLVGSEKLKEYKVVATQPRLNLKLSSGIDFLEGEGDILIGEDHFTISDLLKQFAKNRYVRLSDGNRGILDENYINRLKRIFRRRDKEGRIKVTLFNMPEVEEMINSKLKGEFANRTRAIIEGFNSLKNAHTPAYKVNAKLRPYQNEGVKWLKYLYDNELGGCLADDMGLGKTLQTISLLSLIYPECKTPSLIVMPRSLLFNWEKELKRFAPEISFSTYYGQGRELEETLKSNIVLTTYAIVRNDIEKLKDVTFQCIVLDESQSIKSISSQVTIAVNLLNSDHRFALSGTPMENNLTELYSLFRFLNPPMFGTLEEFNSSYAYPIQKTGDKNASDSLRKKIYPFVLRRLKKDVLDDLPPRIDQTIYVEMSERQRRLYNERRLSYREQIGAAIKRDGTQKSQFLMFQALSELRRIASVPESAGDAKIKSPKIDELIESLVTSVSNGHKAVVFFNFLAGLEIVASHLEKAEIEFESMTGSTSAKARKRIVERFQTDPKCMVMLLTLKVGGVGLNLTAADTVYMFEPWWNKAAEEQAINRLHRIGQKSTVNSFSLITVGTIEEKILQLQEQKSELFNELICADGSTSKFLTEKDIDFILS
ncbi:MAG: DEAD/DEAH box helicase [Muribaculaceae bacterium]|nr:DEAD/DEAH box helicase [Muribaculaceae bacterium]